MVAIVTGNGLGLINTSYTVQGQSGGGVFGDATFGLTGTKVYVNAATGNLVVQDRDAFLAAPGGDLAGLRTYNSRGTFNDDNGDNWINGMIRQSLRVTAGTWGAAGSTVVVTDVDGSERVFSWVAANSRYVSTTGAGVDTYLYTTSDSNVARFTDGAQDATFNIATGKLLTLSSKTLVNATFSYDANGNLASVSADTAGTGERLVYGYSGNQLMSLRALDANGNTVSYTLYAYDGKGRLSQVTVDLKPEDASVSDGKTYVTTYSYVSASDVTDGLLQSMTTSDGSSLTFQWVVSNGAARISKTWGADGQATGYFYGNSSVRQAGVTLPGGFTYDFWYDTQGRLTSSHPSKGAGLGFTNDTIRTYYQYAASGDVASVADELGRSVTYWYNADNDLAYTSDSAGNVIRRVYANHQMVAEIRYATRDPDGAGSADASDPVTTRFVYNTDGQLRFKVSPLGAVTEYRYTGLVQTSEITYLGGVYNVTPLAYNQTLSEAQLQTWVAATDKTKTARVDILPDVHGQPKRETRYATTNANGDGVLDGNQQVTEYVYDGRGQLLKKVDGSASPILYAYDGLGRVLSQQQGGNTTTYVYQDNTGGGLVTTLTDINGLVTVSSYDRMGRLVSVSQGQGTTPLGTTTYSYNARGLLTKTQDPTGVLHWYVYDERNRKAAEVDGNGSITEYRYDNAGQPIQTIRYATPLAQVVAGPNQNLAWADAPATPTIASIRPASTDKDINTWSLYDKAGLLVKQVDSQGYVTEYKRDGLSRLISTTRYATKIDLAAFITAFNSNPATATAVPAVDAVNDRVERTFYDADSRVIGTLDAEGYVTENRYDAAGRLVWTKRYAEPTAADQRAAGSLATLLKVKASARDQVTRATYDNLGQLSGQVDAEGYLTEMLYDDRGHLAQKIRYATVLTADQLDKAEKGFAVAAYRPAANASDHVERWSFNALGQLESSTNADGLVTSYVYDTAGRVVSKQVAASTLVTDIRETQYRYDAQGRVIAELSANHVGRLNQMTGGLKESLTKSLWAVQSTRYTYDAAGRMTSKLDPGGAQFRTLYFYNEDGQLTHTVDPLGQVEEREYDGLGQLIRTVHYGGKLSSGTLATLSGGLASTPIRDAIRELLAQRSASGQPLANSQTLYTYDERGQLKLTVDALGWTTSNRYNAFGEVSIIERQTNGTGQFVQEQLNYDRRGSLQNRVSDAAGLAAKTIYGVDAFGRVTAVTDPAGHVTSTEFDRLGRVVQITDAAGSPTRRTYDAFNQVATETDALGQVTTYRYDLANRTVEITTPEGIKSSITRDRFGAVVARTDGLGVITRYKYDFEGRLVTTTTPLTQTTTGYDNAGNVAYVSDGLTTTSLAYDGLNRIVSRTVQGASSSNVKLVTTYVYTDTDTGTSVLTTNPDGTQTLQTFDVLGQLTSTLLDPNGLKLTTRYTYDGLGQSLTVTDASGTTTQFDYDGLGRRVSETLDAKQGGLQLKKTYSYDLAGQLISARDATNAQTLYVRDANGRLVYQIDPLGAVQFSEYDANGRVSRVTRYATALSASILASLGASPTLADVSSRITKMPSRDEVTGNVYDKGGRLAFTVDAVGTVTENRYDASGHLKQQVVYASTVDPTAWMANPVAPAPSSADRVSSNLYDAVGRLTLTIDAEGGVTGLTYDASGHVKSKTAFARSLGAQEMQALRSAAAGWNESTVALPAAQPLDRTTSYVYDELGRLRLVFDAEGYVTETRYAGLVTTTIQYAKQAAAVGAEPQPSAGDRTTIERVDAAGRVVSVIDPMGVEARSDYDANGRLSVQIRGVGLPEATSTLYRYDAAGRMTEKVVAADTAAEATTRYEYDARGLLVREIDARGVALTQSNADWARAERKRLGFAEFIAGLTDSDVKALLQRFAVTHVYDAAGRRTSTTNAVQGTTSTVYDAFGNAVKVTDPRGNAGYFYFDKLNRVTLQVDPEGYATKTTYWGAGSAQVATVRRYFLPVSAQLGSEPVLTESPKDAVTLNSFDRLDRLVSSRDASGAVESTQYGVGGNRFDKSVTNKLGGTATFYTDRLDRTVSETLPVSAGGRAVVNTYKYDAFGNRVESIEAFGLPEQRTTQFLFDKMGRVTHRIGAAYTAFDGATQVLSSVIPVEWTRYDALGRVVEQISHGNWVNGSQVVGGARSLSSYDAAGNKIVQINADGAYTRYDYDPAGHVVRESAMATPVNVSGSTWSEPASQIAKDRITVMIYDAAGRLTEQRRENVRFWEADPNSAEIVAPLSDYTSVTLQKMEYDAAGNVVRQTDGKGASVYFYFDKLGRQVLRIDQESYAVAWEYESFQSSATKEVKYAVRVPAYATQTDSSQSASLRDPATLRAPLSLTDARVTTYGLDALGRVVEKRLAGVATQYVDASGGGVQRTMDAVTTYVLNGLGNITMQRDLVGLSSDGGQEVWNVTEIDYDALGREVKRQGAWFTDYQGIARRQVTDTEYNGLGLVKRSIQRGTDGNSEADDRISQFDYDQNGERTVAVDAAGVITVMELNAMGLVSRATTKQVVDANGGKADVVKRFDYDAAGRVIAKFDGDAAHVQTGVVERTRYNVFGDVVAKGLGDGWQEFADYNNLGKLERGNSEGGALSFYLYDRNGNATRKITSGVGSKDLSTLSLSQAASDLVELNHTFSVYDRRNQLIKTVEIAVDYQTDVARRKDVVFQKLADLYGAISVQVGSGGSQSNGMTGTAPPASPTPSVGSPQAVSGSDAPSVSGTVPQYGDVRIPPATSQGSNLIGSLLGWDEEYVSGDNPTFSRTRPTPGTIKLKIPAGIGPSSTAVFQIYQRNNGALIASVRSGEIFSAPRVEGSIYYDVVAVVGDSKVYIGAAAPFFETSRVEPNYWNVRFGVSTEASPLLAIPNAVDPAGAPLQPEVTILSGGVERWVDTTVVSSYRNDGAAYRALDFSSFPQDVATTVVVRWKNSAGKVVQITQQEVTRTYHGIQIGAISTIPVADVRILTINGAPHLRFDGVSGSETTKLWYRTQGSSENWTAVTVSYGQIRLSDLPAGRAIEFIYKDSTRHFKGQLLANGTLGSSFINVNTAANPTVTIPLRFTDGLTSVPANSAVNFYLNGSLLRSDLYAISGGGTAITLNWLGLQSAFGLDPMGSGTFSYAFDVAGAVNGRTLRIAAGSGVFTVGTSASGAAYAPTQYQAVAKLKVAADLEGDIVLRNASGEVRRFSKSDLNRWVDGSNTINLNLFGLAAGQYSVSYDGATAKFTGTLTLDPSGLVTVTDLKSQSLGNGKAILTVNGATSLSVTLQGPAGELPRTLALSSTTGTFEWPISPLDIGKTFTVSFEGLASNKIVKYKGSGRYTVSTTGLVTYDAQGDIAETPFLSFPGTSDTKMEIEVVERGTGKKTSFVSADFVRDAAGNLWLDVQRLRPVNGVDAASYDYTYTMRTGTDVIVSKGRGDFSVSKTGAIRPGASVADRLPIPAITFKAPVDVPSAVSMQLVIDGTLTVRVAGQWVTNRMVYTWTNPFDGRVINGPETHSYTMTLLTADGQVALNKAGDPIVLSGEMNLGASGTESRIEIKQFVDSLRGTAQVVTHQAYNAFGEISEEYDDATQRRAEEMVGLYNRLNLGTFTANLAAVTTRFTYNTQGMLISKIEPQTFETLANGFVRRIEPKTTYTYDLLGRMTASTDANGKVRRQSYQGDIAEASVSWTADNFSRETGYDVFGNSRILKTEVTRGNKTTVEQDFDAMGRLVVVRRLGIQRVENFTGSAAVGSTLTERYAYDGLGQRISSTNAAGYTSKTFYDALGRVVKTVSAEGAETAYDYKFVAADEAVDPILGVAGRSSGGFRKTTNLADGHSTVDEVDYFGRTTWHQDLGGRKYTYTYDAAGRLASQVSSEKQDIRYEYLLNGMLSRVTDIGGGSISEFGYDDAGNRTLEAYFDIDSNGNKVARYQSSSVQFDELNRMARVAGSDQTHDIRYEYDAVGNRRAAITIYWNPYTGELQANDELWYTYDDENRFTTSMGRLDRRATSATDTSTKIYVDSRVKEGVLLTYNGAGQRTSAYAADEKGVFHLEEYSYSVDGYLEDTKIDNVLRVRRRLDALGRTAQLVTKINERDVRSIKDIAYDKDNRTKTETVSSSSESSENGVTVYSYLGNNNFGALGQVLFTANDKASGSPITETTIYQYEYWDSAKQSRVNKSSSNGTKAETAIYFNNNGFESRLVETANGTQTRTVKYSTSAQGLILRRDTWMPNVADMEHRYYYSGGRRVGDVGNDGAVRVSYAESLASANETPKQQRERLKHPKPVVAVDFDQNYEPIGPAYPGGTASFYTVVQGDTLSSIAQSVWGDSTMWYLLADANGLSGKDTLVAGQQLVIPNKVTNIHNNANTFRPYNPGEVIGRVDPTLPDPPPPPKNDCGAVGVVLMVVVAVVATVLTAGAVAAALGASVTSGSIGGAALLGGGGFATLTGAAATIGATATAVVSSAIGAAVGSMASQLVGMATGNVEHFSWSAVGKSALAAGASAGIAAGVSFAVNATGWAPLVSAYNASNSGAAMLKVGLSTAATQALRGKWNWREVGAATVGAGVSFEASSFIGTGSDEVTKTLLEGVSKAAGSLASSQVMGYGGEQTRARMGQMFVSTLGNAIGESLLAEVQPTASKPKDLQRVMDAVGAKYEIDESGNLRSGTNRKTLEVMQGLLEAGATVEEATAIANRRGINSALKKFDLATTDRSDAEVARVAQNYISNQQTVLSDGTSIPDGPREVLPSVSVVGKRSGPSGETITASLLAGGVELADGLYELYNEHPRLAKLAYTGTRALLTGGPVKSVVENIAKAALGDAVDNLRAKASAYVQEAVGAWVTNWAAKEGVSTEMSIAGHNVTLGADSFGGAAGEVAGMVSDAALSGGIETLNARAKNVRNIIKEHNAGRHSPVYDKWLKKGNTVRPNVDGSVTYIRKDGIEVTYRKASDGNAYPDFTPHAKYDVPIPTPVSRSTKDYAEANKAAGIYEQWGSNVPEGYRWHHHEQSGRMQLVPADIHDEFRHAGGVAKDRNR